MGSGASKKTKSSKFKQNALLVSGLAAASTRSLHEAVTDITQVSQGSDSDHEQAHTKDVGVVDTPLYSTASTDMDINRQFSEESHRVSLTYTDTSSAWEQLRQGTCADIDTLPQTKFTVKKSYTPLKRQRTVDEDDNEAYDIPYDKFLGSKPLGDVKEEQTITCSLCRSDNIDNALYKCRICARHFHERCLQKIGFCQDEESLRQLHKAKTKVGWSCHECDNLNNILTEEEQVELIENFEKCDVNMDATISVEEYLDYKQKEYLALFHTPMPKEEEDLEKTKFRHMDTDGTGTIDWWEFLNYETIRLLERTRTKNALLRLLTPSEIDTAREAFSQFDLDGDGLITEVEAKKAFSRLPNKAFLIKNRTKHIMDADADNSGNVSWTEFLKQRAIVMLAARPNKAVKHLGNSAVMDTEDDMD
ncbi:PHD finger protein 24 isoform X2 [Lingula anatina]|uniref:PHD finger protein 24 isoform X2 n=1 Tax=Lingula anatina TaxID=7574 RepID=A0A1S3GYC1_LINAN|nr:PHD finger protein 24 isoform X2 [Lingula anatina]|eukprot:XP_013378662.1 PHD finger protein 24 isoform X2 [Lingula anatina]